LTKRFLCLICAERLMEQMSPVEAKRHLGQYGALTAELLERGQLVERNRLLPAETAAAGTLLKRFPTLDEVAETAAFLASDHAGAMTAAIANLSCGALLD